MIRAFNRLADRVAALAGFERRNAPGMVAIGVGVSYRSDPDQVRAVLISVANECPLVLKAPAPLATLDNFGQSALEFSLRATCVRDVPRATVETELRTRILKAFRGAGIEIAHAQYDVHLRDLDAVRVILNRIAEERAARSGVNGERENGPMAQSPAAARSGPRP